MIAVAKIFRNFGSLPFSRAGFVCLICAATALSGCGARRRPSIAWSSAVMVRPTAPAANSEVAPELLEAAPELRVDLTPPPRLATPRAVPPRPRVLSPSRNVDNDSHGDALVLAPQLSPEEAETARRETNQSISATEKNLASSQHRTLSPTQTDLASKVRGFLADAKEAARVGDWDRARSLARKAQILSQDLAGSR